MIIRGIPEEYQIFSVGIPKVHLDNESVSFYAVFILKEYPDYQGIPVRNTQGIPKNSTGIPKNK